MAEEAEWQTIENTNEPLRGRGEHSTELQQKGDLYRVVFKSNNGKIIHTGMEQKCILTVGIEKCNMRLAYMLKW